LVAIAVALTVADARPPELRREPRTARRREKKTPLVPLRVATTLPCSTLTATVPALERSPVVRARILLLLSGVLYGTYTVILRAINAVGGEPLPAVFVTCVRYQFLALFAFALRWVRARQARSSSSSSARATPTTNSSVWLAASELAVYSVVSSLASVFGVQRVPAVMSEILSSTVHIFVPLLSLALVGGASFGPPTWLGCLLAFAAAVTSTVADSYGSQHAAAAGGELLGQGALVFSSFAFGLFLVRTQVHLESHPPEALNSARMVAMGACSILLLLVDVAAGGASARTLSRLQHVLPSQWLLMALSVFLSAFVASALSFHALQVIPAANAQPFAALQPLFCAGWAMLLLNEPISTGAVVGGALMIGATLLACTDSSVHGHGQGQRRK